MFLKLTPTVSLMTEEISSIEIYVATAYSSRGSSLNIYMKSGHSHVIEQTYGYDSNDIYKLQRTLEEYLAIES